jgi:eukaryotic-like serine/threonine-protein kinase
VADLLPQLGAALAGQYRLERELGSGGMSRAFAALEIGPGRKVVIKVLPPELSAGLSVERFHREIQLAAGLQHPRIVPLLSAGQTGSGAGEQPLLYYTMPLVEGETLRARLARELELPVTEAIRILRDIAEALSYAHHHGVIHRDIKPDNVLLTDDHALVTDFGVAGSALALGSPGYMAPEQAAADPHTDHRADIYALGVMGYEILAGRPPFSGPSAQAVFAAQLSQTPLPLSLARARVPAALSAAIMRCLEKRPADRWQRVDELIQMLEQPRTSGAVEAVPELPDRPERSLVRHWAIVLLAVAVGIGVLLAGWLIYQRTGRP